MANFTLTAGADTVVGDAADDTVHATSATLNAGDNLTGGAAGFGSQQQEAGVAAMPAFGVSDAAYLAGSAADNHWAEGTLPADGAVAEDAYLSGGKWGPSGTLGTTGGTVTWSIAGAGLSYQPGSYSTSSFFTGTTVAFSSFLPADYANQIANAFAAWSAVANINFVQVADEGNNFGVGTNANIRIGGGYIDGGGFNILGRAFYAPGGGTPSAYALAGDIVFDSSNTWNDQYLFGVALHEIGHALGLMHVPQGTLSVMNPFLNVGIGLQAEDTANIQVVYGARTQALSGSVSINDVTITEGDSGTKTLAFTVTRSGGTAAFDVNFATSDGTATVADGDFVATSNTLHFGAGENSKTISVTINGDTTLEANESFNVLLSGATNGAFVGDGQGIGNIGNDDVPVVANAIADQNSPEVNAWAFIVPAMTFSDPDGDILTYSATLANGSGLPSWLIFNVATRTFSGMPPANFNGQIALKVIASDGSSTASDTFTLDITPVNDAPVRVNHVAVQSAHNDEDFSFQLPANMFSDPDSALTYTVSQYNGDALPSWLSFNAATRTFSGMPPHDLRANITVKVTASDGVFNTSDIFALTITAQDDLPINGTPRADSLGGDGGDMIHGLGGNDAITGSGNLNMAFGDEGGDQLYFNGNQNQLFGSDGNDWLGVNGTNNALVGGTGDEVWIGASGNSNTLDGGDGNDALFANGNGNALYGGTGSDWLGVSGSSNTMYGGVGNEWMGASGDNNDLLGGEGGDKLFSVGGNFLYGENGNDWVGCSGNGNVLNGAHGNDYLAASGNNNTLDGGAGNDVLLAGGAHGGDRFVFHAGYGMDTLTNFSRHQAGGTDLIDLNGFGLNFDSLQTYIVDGPNCVIVLDAATTLTLNGTSKGQLQADDFIF